MFVKYGTNIKPSGPYSMHTVQTHSCRNTSTANLAMLLNKKYLSFEILFATLEKYSSIANITVRPEIVRALGNQASNHKECDG